jgi:hypothetical protein
MKSFNSYIEILGFGSAEEQLSFSFYKKCLLLVDSLKKLLKNKKSLSKKLFCSEFATFFSSNKASLLESKETLMAKVSVKNKKQVGIHDDKHAPFKILCAKKEITVKDAVSVLVDKALNDPSLLVLDKK